MTSEKKTKQKENDPTKKENQVSKDNKQQNDGAIAKVPSSTNTVNSGTKASATASVKGSQPSLVQKQPLKSFNKESDTSKSGNAATKGVEDILPTKERRPSKDSKASHATLEGQSRANLEHGHSENDKAMEQSVEAVSVGEARDKNNRKSSVTPSNQDQGNGRDEEAGERQASDHTGVHSTTKTNHRQSKDTIGSKINSSAQTLNHKDATTGISGENQTHPKSETKPELTSIRKSYQDSLVSGSKGSFTDQHNTSESRRGSGNMLAEVQQSKQYKDQLTKRGSKDIEESLNDDESVLPSMASFDKTIEKELSQEKQNSTDDDDIRISRKLCRELCCKQRSRSSREFNCGHNLFTQKCPGAVSNETSMSAECKELLPIDEISSVISEQLCGVIDLLGGETASLNRSLEEIFDRVKNCRSRSPCDRKPNGKRSSYHHSGSSACADNRSSPTSICKPLCESNNFDGCSRSSCSELSVLQHRKVKDSSCRDKDISDNCFNLSAVSDNCKSLDRCDKMNLSRKHKCSRKSDADCNDQNYSRVEANQVNCNRTRCASSDSRTPLVEKSCQQNNLNREARARRRCNEVQKNDFCCHRNQRARSASEKRRDSNATEMSGSTNRSQCRGATSKSACCRTLERTKCCEKTQEHVQQRSAKSCCRDSIQQSDTPYNCKDSSNRKHDTPKETVKEIEDKLENGSAVRDSHVIVMYDFKKTVSDDEIVPYVLDLISLVTAIQFKAENIHVIHRKPVGRDVFVYPRTISEQRHLLDSFLESTAPVKVTLCSLNVVPTSTSGEFKPQENQPIIHTSPQAPNNVVCGRVVQNIDPHSNQGGNHFAAAGFSGPINQKLEASPPPLPQQGFSNQTRTCGAGVAGTAQGQPIHPTQNIYFPALDSKPSEKQTKMSPKTADVDIPQNRTGQGCQGNDLKSCRCPRFPAQFYKLGEIIGNEDRTVEFKSGQGNLEKQFNDVVCKYITAFLNGDGGTLMFGVNDSGEVIGIPECDQQREDKLRQRIDSAVKMISPQLFPPIYSVRFLPIRHPANDSVIANLKVIEICTESGVSEDLYQTPQGEAYIRRDGSVQGPLKATDIQEWTRTSMGQRKKGTLNQQFSTERTLAELQLEQKRVKEELESLKQQYQQTDSPSKRCSDKFRIDELFSKLDHLSSCVQGLSSHSNLGGCKPDFEQTASGKLPTRNPSKCSITQCKSSLKPGPANHLEFTPKSKRKCRKRRKSFRQDEEDGGVCNGCSKSVLPSNLSSIPFRKTKQQKNCKTACEETCCHQVCCQNCCVADEACRADNCSKSTNSCSGKKTNPDSEKSQNKTQVRKVRKCCSTPSPQLSGCNCWERVASKACHTVCAHQQCCAHSPNCAESSCKDTENSQGVCSRSKECATNTNVKNRNDCDGNERPQNCHQTDIQNQCDDQDQRRARDSSIAVSGSRPTTNFRPYSSPPVVQYSNYDPARRGYRTTQVFANDLRPSHTQSAPYSTPQYRLSHGQHVVYPIDGGHPNRSSMARRTTQWVPMAGPNVACPGSPVKGPPRHMSVTGRTKRHCVIS